MTVERLIELLLERDLEADVLFEGPEFIMPVAAVRFATTGDGTEYVILEEER